MEFKTYEYKPKGIRAWLKSPHIRKTLISILLGILAGFGYFFISEGRHASPMILGDSIQYMLFGGFIGFFITNSPCAQNKC